MLHVEAWAHVYWSEVGAVGAVIMSGHGDVLSLEDARVALKNLQKSFAKISITFVRNNKM